MTGRVISSTTNPLVKDLVRLSTRSGREDSGQLLIEGHREVARALGSGVTIDTVIVCDGLLSSDAGGLLAALPDDVDVYAFYEPAFRKISRRQNPDGIAVRARTPDTTLPEPITRGTALVLVAEATEKPGNFGAMLRTAEGLGVDLVIAVDPVTDVFSPNVIRASQGAVFAVPVAVVDAPGAQAWLAASGCMIVAGYPTGSPAPWELDLSGSLAVLVGAEDVGISPRWERDVVRTTVPMVGHSDSLNTATTAAMLLYEAVRQRA